MSLINDALKRAKDAQQKTLPIAPGPQLRPAEIAPAAAIPHGPGMTAPAIVILIVLTGVFLLLQLRRNTTENRTTQTKISVPANPVPETKPVVQQIAISTPTPAVKPPVPTLPAAPKALPTPAPAPAPLKLQAIFFAPGRSSAIISGKTVRAGDTVRGFHVAVINQASATLVSSTQTNVMTLEQ